MLKKLALIAAATLAAGSTSAWPAEPAAIHLTHAKQRRAPLAALDGYRIYLRDDGEGLLGKSHGPNGW
jgi:hypothetical protein